MSMSTQQILSQKGKMDEPHTGPLEGPQQVQAFDGTPPIEVPEPMEVGDQAVEDTQPSRMDIEDGRAAALNGTRTGGGLDIREGRDDDSSTTASNMAKKRKIDENTGCNDSELEHVNAANTEEDSSTTVSNMAKKRRIDENTGYNDLELEHVKAANTEEDKANKHNEKAPEETDEKGRHKAQNAIIKVARDEDLFKQIGKDIYLDLVDHDKVLSFRIEMQKPFNAVKEAVAKESGVPVQYHRFWTWAKRKNHTYRIYRPLTWLDEKQSVGQLMALYKKNTNEMNLFLEIVIGLDLRPLPLPDISEEDILVFFKLYDPEKSQLRYVGRLYVRSCGKPTDIISELKEKAGLSGDEEIELYEEIKFERYHESEFEPCVLCERLDKRASFKSSQIGDGDIICFQKLPQAQDWGKYKYPDVPSYLEYVNNRQVVRFRSMDKPEKDAFSLELSKLNTYDDMAERVAQKLNLDDASKIRFTPHDIIKNQPDPDPILYKAEGDLLDILCHILKDVSDIIVYYELLDIPLPEFQRTRTFKVEFYHATTYKEEPEIHTITVPKQSTVGDVLNEIKTKAKASPDAELRLFQLGRHRIIMVFSPTQSIDYINDKHSTLRAEKIPEEDRDVGPGCLLIHVYHFTKDDQMEVKNFGEPFLMAIRENETLAALKVRIRHKLEVDDEEFSKWKFAFVYQKWPPVYLQDSHIVFRPFQRTRYSGGEPPYLGLEHPEQLE